MTDNLVITNYDNFKDLSYFIGQYHKAEEMMKEVTDFYISFLKSKLICNHEINLYPGKVIGECFHNMTVKKRIESRYDEDIFDKIVNGARLQDKDGYWYTVSKVKFKKKADFDYSQSQKDYVITYDVARPYYIELLDFRYSSWRLSTHKIDETIKELEYHVKNKVNGEDDTKREAIKKQIAIEEEKRNKIIDQEKEAKRISELLVDPTQYNNQKYVKEQLANYYKNYCNRVYYVIDPETGYLHEFANEDELSKFQFKLSDDNKYLIVFTANYDGGTRTDRWMTFEYKGTRYNEYWFETSTGNFVDHKNYLIKDWETKLNVHNGWHPFDDD